MRNTIQPENQKRFVQLLRVYLTKTGRKQVELARATHVTESMLSKVLKGKAAPNQGDFCTFQAPFLVAYGGITQARQVSEMVQLLGGELDEAGLLNIAKIAERYKDPELDTIHFRDRAESFRQTIPAALAWTETDPATIERAEPGPTAAEPPVELASSTSDEQSTEPAPDEQEEQPSASAAEAMAAALAEWRSMLRDLAQPAPAETLDPDEVIAVILDWESQQTDPQMAAAVWDWLGSPETLEKLRQRARLEFVLHAHDGQKTWNQLEWQWLNHVLVETAQRQAGGSQLSPSQLLAFVTDLGRVAFEAVKADDGKTAYLAVDLADLASQLPIVQATDWRWLQNLAQAGPMRLSISADRMCRFESREEAEFLAAQYLLGAGSDQALVGIARNCGQPFGVFRQAVRSLHFAGRDEAAGKLINELLRVSEVIPLRYADAAHLLAACEAPTSSILSPIWDAVEWKLYQSWTEMPAPQYRAYIARAFRGQDSPSFRQAIQQALQTERLSDRHAESTLRCLAIAGGPAAVEILRSLAETPIAPGSADNLKEWPWNPLHAVLAVAPELAPSDQVVLLEGLALGAAVHDEQWRAVSALAHAGSIPAIRALERIADGAQDAKLGRYAETQSELLDSPARAALVARQLDAAAKDAELATLLARMHAAKVLLLRSTQTANTPETRLPVVSRSLARVWANLDLRDGVRIETALGLIAANAWPALEICLGTLPLADQANNWQAHMLARLLPALVSPAVTARLWQLLDLAASPEQRAILIRCLGRAGGIAPDERFEQFLTGPSELVAAAAVAALAESQGPVAAGRLTQIAAGDGRHVVQAAANEGLAAIGSDQALPYLREKLKDANQHADACYQLARLHYPDAEVLLVEAARATEDKAARYRLYWPALAMSGGAMAVQALHDLLGPEPDDLTLSQVRAELPPDTVTRAPEVWSRLAADPSPAWRMTAVAILVQDPTQALIDRVVRIAVEDPEWPVCSFARACLHRDAPTIAPPAVAEYVLDQLQQQYARYSVPDEYLLGLTGKCLRGLAGDGRGLPPDIARRVRTVLGRILFTARPTEEYFVPLLGAVAIPEFWEGAGELERQLATVTDATTQVHILDTLIAMQAPSLPDVVIRLAVSARWPALQARAIDYLVEEADYDGLAQAPNELKHLAYRIAIRKGIRFRRDGLRHKVILSNGAAYVRPAQ